jgi:hypothetical protein
MRYWAGLEGTARTLHVHVLILHYDMLTCVPIHCSMSIEECFRWKGLAGRTAPPRALCLPGFQAWDVELPSMKMKVPGFHNSGMVLSDSVLEAPTLGPHRPRLTRPS